MRAVVITRHGGPEVLRATCRRCCDNLGRMPFATVPWWKSPAVMNENKGVFGLNSDATSARWC